jgi:uncharacterized protein (TIGR02145 family)
MKILSILCLPFLSSAATFTGTVVDLSGTPIAGAVVKTSVDSATTSGNGAWSLARTLSVARRKAIPIPGASHLVVENGHPRLAYGGVDASGHRSLAGTASFRASAARTTAAAGTDTLRLYWKGKRLVVMPIASLDSTGIVLRVDTAWSDDANIPWNPAVSYGTLADSRDGRAYRTVVIGTQTGMAENLNYAGTSAVPVGQWYKNSSDSGAKYGRFYTWSEALAGHASSMASPSGVQGVCPTGWHVPSDEEWSSLVAFFGDESSAGSKLKSTSGWSSSGNGTDTYGFRALPGGWWTSAYGFFPLDICLWWSATEYDETDALSRSVYNSVDNVEGYDQVKTNGFSLRCLKDMP